MGGGGFWPPFYVIIIFIFFSTSSSSLSLLAPLPLFTSFFLLHFLHFYTISCLENHFSRLPNLIFSISQNIFSNPWVLDHLCETHFLKFIFFWKSSLHFHGISSWTNFFYFQWEEISSIPRMERWRGAPSRPKHPCSTLIQKGFQVSLFFFFFVGKFVDFLFCWELYSGILSFCCCLSLWEFWTLLHLVGNHCVVMFFFFLTFFELLSCLVLWNLDNVDGLWSFALYVACGIAGWILT